MKCSSLSIFWFFLRQSLPTQFRLASNLQSSCLGLLNNGKDYATLCPNSLDCSSHSCQIYPWKYPSLKWLTVFQSVWRFKNTAPDYLPLLPRGLHLCPLDLHSPVSWLYSQRRLIHCLFLSQATSLWGVLWKVQLQQLSPALQSQPQQTAQHPRREHVCLQCDQTSDGVRHWPAKALFWEEQL